jgi:tetratricopeptide (TPR) repeat protein
LTFFLVGSLLVSALLVGQQPSPLPDAAAARQAETTKDFASAEAIYDRLVAVHPEDALLYQRLGLVRHLQNKFTTAADAFQKAIKLDASLWISQLFLGIDLYRMNQFATADTHLEIANRLRPEEPEVVFWLGATKLARHDFIRGFEILEELLKRDPSNAEALRILAETYATYGTSLLNEVGEKYPDSPAGLVVQGKAYEFDGDYGPALASYRAAFALAPDRPGLRDSIERVQALLRGQRDVTH